MPSTVKELRSYLGQYKVFYRNMENMSKLLDPLEKLTGEKDNKTKIQWTDELIQVFENSKSAVKQIKPLYLPKRTDQLAISLDWSKQGIGGTLWALLEDSKEIVGYFSAPLTGGQSNWPPCDGEGLAANMALDRFSKYIKEATKPTLILSDNKPTVQAVKLLLKGSFSTSPRLNKLLSNCNSFPIVFHHLSGKMNLNEESDMQSRNPAFCNDPHCEVCLKI